MTDVYLYIQPDCRPDFGDSPFSVFIFARKIIIEITALPDTFQVGQKGI